MSNTGDPSSFGHSTARERWPRILQKVIDDLAFAANIDFSGVEEVPHEKQDHTTRHMLRSIHHIREAIIHNEELVLMREDMGEDIEDYNAELYSFDDAAWLKCPWLYAECYMYRYLHTIFMKSQDPRWLKYDAFWTSKREAIISSQKGVLELLNHFNSVLSSLTHNDAAIITDHDTQHALFEEMVQISLWGNATDLSLLQNVSTSQLSSLQGRRAREASAANVLVDHTSTVFSLLSSLKCRDQAGEIHIILDNSGFELLTDLVFASFLLAAGYAAKVVLHGKAMPWFVSDVNAHDLHDLVTGLQHNSYYADISPSDESACRAAGNHFASLQEAGTLVFEAHPFWTTAHPFGRMKVVAPALYKRLEKAELVIYKGDLNYRKLTYDALWPHTTAFEEAIGPLKTGTRTLALRTAKADVAVGVPREKLEGMEEGWTRTGKWGMVQFWDGKKVENEAGVKKL